MNCPPIAGQVQLPGSRAAACDHRHMSDDDRDPRSFEETVREIADEVRRSIERASHADPEEMVRAAGVDPDRVREWVDIAGEWLRSQLEGTGGERAPRSEPGTHSGDDLLRDAEPHPLDVPTAQQGTALAALDSGRWTLEPGTSALSVRGGGPGPATPSGWSASCASATGLTRTAS